MTRSHIAAVVCLSLVAHAGPRGEDEASYTVEERATKSGRLRAIRGEPAVTIAAPEVPRYIDGKRVGAPVYLAFRAALARVKVTYITAEGTNGGGRELYTGIAKDGSRWRVSENTGDRDHEGRNAIERAEKP